MLKGSTRRDEAMSASTSGRNASATPSFCDAASIDSMLVEKRGPRLPSTRSATPAAASHFCQALPWATRSSASSCSSTW
jgi:hypothetical protein